WKSAKMRLGRRTTRRTVVIATDRRGLRRPILGHFFCCSLLPLDGKCDGPSKARRSVEGLRFKILQLLESGYWDHFSDLHDEPAGRTVMAMTVRHKLRNPTLGQTSLSSFSSCTTLPPTDRHSH
ncbi:hypothetical protein EJD97_012363, partial [Solanum chilense]